MSKAITCDQCEKVIDKNDIRIEVNGYRVRHNEAKPSTQYQGYGVGCPEDFCSFTCMAAWATEQQELLSDYLALVAQREGAEHEGN